MNQQKVVTGMIVMFVLGEGNNVGDSRPAIVIKAMDAPSNSCNLRVFIDGPNDTVNGPIDTWKQSVAYDPNKAPGTWHWPDQVALVEEPESTGTGDEF